jgi:hypothetical protein
MAGDSFSEYRTAVLAHWKAVLITWAAAAGILAGISVVSALRWPLWLWVLVLALGLIVAQFRAWQEQHDQARALSAQVRHYEGRKAVREDLAGFIGEGETILIGIERAIGHVPPDDPESWQEPGEGWIEEVETFLRDNLGADYEVRFQSLGNVPTREPHFVCPHYFRGFWNGICQRIERLHEFVREFGPA